MKPDNVDFLFADFTEISEITKPFPLTTEWKQFVPNNIFNGSIVTHAYPYSRYNRDIILEGIPQGTSPFDGLLEIYSELHYCDSWFIGYYLVIRGKARGQIWMCYAQITSKNEPNLTFKPIAKSFLDWYISWLENEVE